MWHQRRSLQQGACPPTPPTPQTTLWLDYGRLLERRSIAPTDCSAPNIKYSTDSSEKNNLSTHVEKKHPRSIPSHLCVSRIPPLATLDNLARRNFRCQWLGGARNGGDARGASASSFVDHAKSRSLTGATGAAAKSWPD